MISELQNLIDQIREQIPEANRALTSEPFSRIETMYNDLYNESQTYNTDRENWRTRESALIEENNRLFRSIPTRAQEEQRNQYDTSSNPHIVSDNTDNPEPAIKVLDIDDLLFGKGNDNG